MSPDERRARKRERNRAWAHTPAGKAYYLEANRRERAIRNEQRNARKRLERAVATGKVVRKPCYCGRPDSQAHHGRGYAGPAAFDVDWLCALHHAEAHRRMRAA